MDNANSTSGKNNSVENNKRKVIFELAAERGLTVFVAGSFNDWNHSQKPMIDKNDDGIYSCTLMLAPGTYEYKFRIDGIWAVAPE